jgi:hypothetical protein
VAVLIGEVSVTAIVDSPGDLMARTVPSIARPVVGAGVNRSEFC